MTYVKGPSTCLATIKLVKSESESVSSSKKTINSAGCKRCSVFHYEGCAEFHAWISKSWEGKPRWDELQSLPSHDTEKVLIRPHPDLPGLLAQE